MKTNNNIILGQDQYTEQVICSKCGQVSYRDIEKYKIYTEDIDENPKELYALFIKKFICTNCGSEEFKSHIIEGQLVTTKSEGNIITLSKKVKKSKNQEEYKVNVI